MYRIMYKEPMTGSILEAQALTLADVVEAIEKVKSDFYYKGASGSVADIGYSVKENLQEGSSDEDLAEGDNKVSAVEDEEENITASVDVDNILDLEDVWNPYGGFSW